MRRPSVACGIVACVFLTLVVVIMGRQLLPNHLDDPAYLADPARWIWILSLLGLCYGLGRAAADLRRLGRERHALDHLDTRTSLDQLREMVERNHPLPEPLAVVRAREVIRVHEEEGVAPLGMRDRLRDEAVGEMAQVASPTRFVASVLLLLAVLGTFAGMKTALPRLIDGISGTPAASAPAVEGLPAEAAVSADTVSQRIGAALTPVSDAFGANFLALLGSLALGIAAFGAAAERARLLHDLERVSERRLYVHLRRPTQRAQSALEDAIHELRDQIGGVVGVGQQIQHLGASIGTFQDTLVSAIESLRGTFANSLQDQHLKLQTELQGSVGQVVQHLLAISNALAGTAQSYEGLVKGMVELDQGVKKASVSLSTSGVKITEALERTEQRIGEAVNGASVRMADSAAALAEANRQVAENSGRIRGTVEAAAEEVAALRQEVTAAVVRSSVAIEAVPARLEGLHEQTERVRGAVAALDAMLGGALAGARADSAEGRRAAAAALEGLARALTERLAALETGQGEVCAQASRTAAAVEGLQVPLASVQASVDGLREPMVSVRTGVDALQAPLASVQASVDGLREPVTLVRSSVDALQAPLASVQASVDGLREPVASIRASVDALQVPIASVQASVDSLREPVASVRTSVDELRVPLAAVQTSMDGLREPMASIRMGVDALQAPLTSVQASVDGLREPVALVRSSVDELRVPLAAVQTSVDGLREPVLSVRSGVDGLRVPLASVELGVEALRTPLASMQASVEALQAPLASVRMGVEALGEPLAGALSVQGKIASGMEGMRTSIASLEGVVAASAAGAAHHQQSMRAAVEALRDQVGALHSPTTEAARIGGESLAMLTRLVREVEPMRESLPGLAESTTRAVNALAGLRVVGWPADGGGSQGGGPNGSAA